VGKYPNEPGYICDPMYKRGVKRKILHFPGTIQGILETGGKFN